MRQFCSILLFLIFLAYSCSNLVIVADFYVNQDYIAANLCVNKDKPWMHCNGHCQLSKKMQEEENKDKQNTDHKSENKTEAVCINYVPLQPGEITPGNLIIFPIYRESISIVTAKDIFHPPQSNAA